MAVRCTTWRPSPGDHVTRAVTALLTCTSLALLGCRSVHGPTDELTIGLPPGLVVVGDTLRLTAASSDWRATSDPDPAWTSSDPGVATVSADGLLTAVSAGVTTVRATADGAIGELRVEVVAPLPRFTSVAAGGEHTCALSVEGRAYCWGRNDWGQLGRETEERCEMGIVGPDDISSGATAFLPCSTVPVAVSGGPVFASLVSTVRYTCGLTEAGEAFCWGRNHVGQLGDGSQEHRSSPEPVTGDHRFRSLSLARTHACGVTLSDETLCWGSGPLPDTESSVPVRVAAEHRFRTVATSGAHTCGTTVESRTLCWGWNNSLQLGVDTVSTTCVSNDRVLPCTDVPQPVTDEIAFTALDANLSYTCGLGDGGRAYCWGSNDWGQLADGETVDRAPPRPLVGEPAFSSVTAGRSFACALDAEGQAFCWGRNSNGNFGLGNKWGGIIPQPVAAATGHRFQSLTAGHSHTCGVDLEGFVWCFGASTRGEVGTGEYFVSALRPVRVEGQR